MSINTVDPEKLVGIIDQSGFTQEQKVFLKGLDSGNEAIGCPGLEAGAKAGGGLKRILLPISTGQLAALDMFRVGVNFVFSPALLVSLAAMHPEQAEVAASIMARKAICGGCLNFCSMCLPGIHFDKEYIYVRPDLCPGALAYLDIMM